MATPPLIKFYMYKLARAAELEELHLCHVPWIELHAAHKKFQLQTTIFLASLYCLVFMAM